MGIKNKYVVEFQALINEDSFEFENLASSSIFQRRLLNYLSLTGYGYAFKKLIKVFIRKEPNYLEVAKGILSDIGILDKIQLEDKIIYTPKGNTYYAGEELLNDIENNLKSIDKVFNVNSYLKRLEEEEKYDYKNIRTCLMCEELMLNTPVVTRTVLKCLDNMYEKGIYTKNSPSILKVIGISIGNKYVSSKRLLIESYGRSFDLNFINKIISIYSFENPSDEVDEVINRVINSEKFYFNEKFIPIIYDFYRRYGDLKALDIICEKASELSIKLKSYNIKSKEVGEVLKFYSNMELYKEKKDVILNLLNEYGELSIK